MQKFNTIFNGDADVAVFTRHDTVLSDTKRENLWLMICAYNEVTRYEWWWITFQRTVVFNLQHLSRRNSNETQTSPKINSFLRLIHFEAEEIPLTLARNLFVPFRKDFNFSWDQRQYRQRKGLREKSKQCERSEFSSVVEQMYALCTIPEAPQFFIKSWEKILWKFSFLPCRSQLRAVCLDGSFIEVCSFHSAFRQLSSCWCCAPTSNDLCAQINYLSSNWFYVKLSRHCPEKALRDKTVIKQQWNDGENSAMDGAQWVSMWR